MTTTTTKRVITSLRKFKEAVRSTELTNAYTGRTTKAVQLIYGFDNHVYIHQSSIKAAYQHYCENYERYDPLISKNSWLYE